MVPQLTLLDYADDDVAVRQDDALDVMQQVPQYGISAVPI